MAVVQKKLIEIGGKKFHSPSLDHHYNGYQHQRMQELFAKLFEDVDGKKSSMLKGMLKSGNIHAFASALLWEENEVYGEKTFEKNYKFFMQMNYMELRKEVNDMLIFFDGITKLVLEDLKDYTKVLVEAVKGM